MESIRTGAAHVRALDGVRGTAILLVMSFHFVMVQGASKAESYLTRVSSFGETGVDLFFVLSGLLITGILLDRKSRPLFFRNFYMRRTLRIFPLYYALVLVGGVILPGLQSLAPQTAARFYHGGGLSPEVWWHLTYTSNFLVAWKRAWLHGGLTVTWSLAIEEQYYLIWAVVVYLASPAVLKRVCVATIVCAPLLRIALLLSGWTWIQIYVFTPCRVDALAWGSLLAVILRQAWGSAPSFHKWSRRILLMTGVPLFLWVAGSAWHHDRSVEFTAGYSIVDLCFVALVAVVTSGPHLWASRVFEAPVLTFLGKYSYALYLFHMPIRTAVYDHWFSGIFARATGTQAVLWQFVFAGVTTAACIPPVLLSWNLLEKPFLRLKERFP